MNLIVILSCLLGFFCDFFIYFDFINFFILDDNILEIWGLFLFLFKVKLKDLKKVLE